MASHTIPTTPEPAPEQLVLLPEADVPMQFRLDQHTRQLGLAKIAELRARLAA